MIESAARACPQCGKPLVRRKQKYCGHKCAFAVIGHKVRAAATTPSALKKIGNALRGRGRGVSYIKRDGRHEHRVIAEQKIGRPLKKGEVVHHLDGNKRNNSPDNLQVLPSRAEHSRIHAKGSVRAIVTHCKYGHALTPDNIGLTTRGARRCIICRRAYDNEWKKARRREQAKFGASHRRTEQ